MQDFFLLDTNVVITVLNDNADDSVLFTLSRAAISAITVMELYALSGMSAIEEKMLREIIKPMYVLSVDENIAKHAGILARTRANRRHRNDLLIAATALEFDLLLLTSNKKDFTGIPGLKIRTAP